MVKCNCGETISQEAEMLLENGLIEKPICDTCFNLKDEIEPPTKPVRNWKKNAWFPERYHLADMNDFDNQPLYDLVKDWYSSKSNLLTLTGNVGSGKTHFACAVAYRLHDRAGKVCRFVSAPDMIDYYRGASCGNDLDVSRKMLCNGCDVLVLDDIGAQRTNEFAYEALYSVLSSGQRVIITTNLDAKGIASELDDRIASRLNGGYIVTFSGKDRRADGIQNRLLTV